MAPARSSGADPDPAPPRRRGGHCAGRLVAGLLAALLLAVVVPLAAAGPARADLAICNHTSYVAEAALGIEQSGVKATRGWFRIEPGACRTVLRGDVAADHLYLHARALPLYGPVAMTGTGGVPLCAGSGDFLVTKADTCTGEGQALLPFAEVKPSGEGDQLSLHLAEKAEYSDEQARLAAVQRLLGLLGYDPGPIDGTTGAKTEAALAAFLDDRRLPPEAAESGLTDRMLDALRAGEGTGLLWCNDTHHAVMAAFAREEKGGIVASGWWRIEPGRCLRPEQENGRAGRLFSFAAAIDGHGAPVLKPDGSPLTWGGDQMLCTRANRFEIRDHTDCKAQGFDTTGFAAVALSKTGGATVRFAP